MRDPLATLRDLATLGARSPTDGNGHLPAGDELITDTATLGGARVAAWDAVKIARDLHRPHAVEVIERVFSGFQEMHGDRLFRDDPAIVGGIGLLDGHPVVVVGQQKGSSTEENIQRNFGMPHPEGYRKAIRLYRLAERFHVPLVTLIDTPGAFPGPEAEERGQAEAIAKSIEVMTRLRTPVVAVVLGEGGSGGALALGVADVVLSLQNAIYSVISPEGAAAILWRTGSEAERAARSLRLAGPDLLELRIVDGLIPEPPGGAHTDADRTAANVKAAIAPQLERLARKPIAELLTERYERFRRIGVVVEPAGAVAPPKRSWWKRVLGR
ncbi:MAG: acetyl-CoA carboxylase carboxyltransferase subunit alpha [Chloroflexota bacterium]|nr:acetyl-CoA carboxylase carboxyltransferase subunit alpha [Chloroflexota bacterium]MDE3101407.1 acetyl-CoA carboxylase carboxyltransferase subunit alpha [Chloroflexota bacterium]